MCQLTELLLWQQDADSGDQHGLQHTEYFFLSLPVWWCSMHMFDIGVSFSSFPTLFIEVSIFS